MHSRRQFIKNVSGGLLLVGGSAWTGAAALGAKPSADVGPMGLPSGTLAESTLESLPGKVALIKRTYRPPNFETPISYYNNVITPNDAFFVRYHLANIPQVNAQEWRLSVGGDAAQKPYQLTLEELKRDFEPVEITAVCQCSGNRRGLSQPHVAGVEWGYGAMGNARWKGARVRDILNRAGVSKDALEVVIDGSDGAPLPATPDFVKSIPVWRALDENTLIAYEMNGAPLPHWNGFPARLIVPGWTGTYWMKHIVTLNAVTQPFKGFWMNPAYRIPTGKFPVVDRFLSQETPANTPITEMVVNSLITNLHDNQQVPVGRDLTVQGITWDGGYGIRTVEVSLDDGKSWREAALDTDHGRYSFRQWRYTFKPQHKGQQVVMVKATNSIGQTQAYAYIFNPAGYHHNVVQRLAVQVV